MKRIITLIIAMASVYAVAQTYEVATNFLATNFVAKATTNTTQFTTNVFDARFYNRPVVVVGIQTDGVDNNGVFTVEMVRTWDYYLTNYLTTTNLTASVTNAGTTMAVWSTPLDMQGLSGFKPVRARYTGTNDITNAFFYVVGKGYTKDRQ